MWVRDPKHDVGFPPVFALCWKGPFIIKDVLDHNVYHPRTNFDISGKRSTALALPINGSRLRLATTQELSVVIAKAGDRALRDSVDGMVSFVIAL